MSSILERAALGFQWPTLDPFLFCVHHVDDYPAGNADFGPATSLVGRNLGSDFEPIDGWRMYHGETVPGFPAHPHRGFETVTFVRRGLIDHSDSLGAAARFGRGDAQWLTAGSGIVHSEMFPLLSSTEPNPVELFQIWLNLPSTSKMVDPYFTMLWGSDLGHHRFESSAGLVEVTTIAGALDGVLSPSPPPDSWASQPEADVAIWHIRMGARTRWTLPSAASTHTRRGLYCYSDGGLAVDDEAIDGRTVAIVTSDALVLEVGSEAVECLLLQGRPIGEPVAQYGPFVMNDRAGIEQAFEDYRATGFGGWPWDRADPVHGDSTQDRFARHPG